MEKKKKKKAIITMRIDFQVPKDNYILGRHKDSRESEYISSVAAPVSAEILKN
jgi:hypothetical protein